MNRKKSNLVLVLGIAASLLLLTACELSETSIIPSPIPTSTAPPSATSTSTLTPEPTVTSTPIPTSTPISTPTPAPLVLPVMQLNLKVGDVFRLRMINDQEISQTIEGQTQDTLQKFGFAFTYTVTDVDEQGNTSIDIVYDWVLFLQDSVAGKIEFDSSRPPDEIPPEMMGYSALVGNGFSMLLTPRGEVLGIEGLDEMYDEMLAAIDITDAELRMQFEEAFRQLYNEETLKDQMNNVVFSYPDSPIQIGNSWTSTTKATTVMPLITENTFTLRSYKGNIATIDLVSTVTTDEEAELDLGVFKVRYFLSGVQEGVTTLDVETGWTVSATITQSFSGEMTLLLEGEELTVPMSINSTVTLETID